MVEHEFDVYRQHVYGFAHFVVKAVKSVQTRCVLFGGYYHARLGHGGECAVNQFDVGRRERMMVGKGKRTDVGAVGGKVEYHLLWRCYASEQHNVFVFADAVKRALIASEERMKLFVVESGEIESLVGIKVHGLCNDPEFHWLEVGRTLGYDDDVGPVLARQLFAQAAGGQQLVVYDKSVIVDKQYVYAGFDVSVLEGIVEQHHVDTSFRLVFGKPADAVTPVAVNGNGDVGKLLHHLIGLVADGACRGVLVGHDVATAFALVATAEHCHTAPVAQQVNEILNVRGLAGTTYGYVAYRDDRHVKTLGLEQSYIEQRVAYLYANAVEPAQRQQPFVYLYEIALHLSEIEYVRQACLNGVMPVNVL